MSTISIAFKLNIIKYIDTDIIIEKKIDYNLYGIINHEGTLNFGHYYSFIKNNNANIWNNYNDNEVNEIKFNSDSNTVYILVYIKMNN